jgi:hypothetical protein
LKMVHETQGGSVFSPDAHKILDKTFTVGLTPPQAREKFQRDSSLFGLINLKGRVDEVIKGYTPVAAIALSQSPSESEGWSNTLHVDLNTLDVYYVASRSFPSGTPQVKTNTLLNSLMNLTSEAQKIASLLIERQELSGKSLTREELSFLNQNPHAVNELSSTGLLTQRMDTGTLMSEITFPNIRDERLNLNLKLEAGGSIETRDYVCNINHDLMSVQDTLESVFYCDSNFNEIRYLPFYQCKFRRGGGTIEYTRMYAPKIKGEGL